MQTSHVAARKPSAPIVSDEGDAVRKRRLFALQKHLLPCILDEKIAARADGGEVIGNYTPAKSEKLLLEEAISRNIGALSCSELELLWKFLHLEESRIFADFMLSIQKANPKVELELDEGLAPRYDSLRLENAIGFLRDCGEPVGEIVVAGLRKLGEGERLYLQLGDGYDYLVELNKGRYLVFEKKMFFQAQKRMVA